MDIRQLHTLESDFLAQPNGDTSQLLDFHNSNEFKLFVYKYRTFPNVIKHHGVDVMKVQHTLLKSFKEVIQDMSYYMEHNGPAAKSSGFLQDNISGTDMYIFFQGNIILYLDESSQEARLLFRNADMDLVERLRMMLDEHVAASHRESHINLIVKDSNGGLGTQKVKITKTDLAPDKHYNEGFVAVDEVIKKRLNQADDKGLVLLHGIPGTGKTTYIRHLIGELDKEVLFLPPQVAAQMTSPDMLDFFVSNPNTILVIEDAEELIVDRGAQQGSAVSALLNLTDGLLSDCLNIQVICSFNTDIARVDTALMRKGRLIASYEFKALEVSKANALAEELETEVVYNTPKTLAEIYNHEDGDYQLPKKRVVGFR